MTQRLRAMTVLPEVLCSIPSTHMVLTTICNGIQYSLLVCLKIATVYSYAGEREREREREREKKKRELKFMKVNQIA